MIRIVRSPLVWLALAVSAIALLAAYWPRPTPRPDAGRPARPFAPHLLGPSPREVVEAVGRRGFPSPPDAVGPE